MNIWLKDDERIDDLSRGMKIIQSSSTPCFSIDAVLLADFVTGKAKARIIELGSGTGVIPLLLTTKIANAQITGIEIIAPMCSQAQRSVALNGLESCIEIIQGDLRTADQYLGRDIADIVVANPPYYKKGHGRNNQNDIFAAARAEEYCTIDDITLAGSKLLKPWGEMDLIFTADRLAELISSLLAHKLNPEKLRIVQPYRDQNANLVLVAARKGGKGALQVLPSLIVYESKGQYTKEMLDIYGR